MKLKRSQGDWVPVYHSTDLRPKPRKTFPRPEIKDTHAQLAERIRLERGITPETLKAYSVGFEEVNGSPAVVFPYFQKGEIVLQKKRLLDQKKFFRELDCPSILFGLQHVKGKEVIVTEGEFDTLAAHQLGYEDVVSVPNGANVSKNGTPSDCEWLKQLDGFEKVYLALDNDAKGEEAAKELANKLGSWRCERWLLPAKDLNECLAGGMTKDELDPKIKKISYKDENLVHVKDFFHEVYDYWINSEQSKGIQTRFMDLNERLGGIRDSEVSVLTGDTGSGKTTLCLNLVEDLILRGVPCLVASTEMAPRKLIGKMFSIHSQKNFLKRESMTLDHLMEAMKYFEQQPFYFVDVRGELPLETIQSVIAYSAKIYGVRFVLLDHLHYFLNVKRAEDERIQIERFMTGITKAALENGVHILLISHPTKQGGDKVTMHHLRGSSRIYQDASNVAVICRDKDAEAAGHNIVEVNLQKVRDDAGRGGLFTLEFDYETQRFRDSLLPSEPPRKEKRYDKKNIQYIDSGSGRSDLG
jgi:twinkle protein